MKIGFYPGCSLNGTAREYNESVKALAKAFQIELVEINDWNCCGASAAHNMDKTLSLSLPARILALAEQQGLTEVVIPCAACYNRLASTRHELAHDKSLNKKVTATLDIPYHGKVETLNVIQFIDKYITPYIDNKLERPFAKKVACYYGCLLVRPNKVLNFDREEDPMSMDNVMKQLGADSLDWAFKTECCGAGLSVSRTSSVSRLCGNIIEDAALRGAEAIIVACPMCHSNLDMRRPEINAYMNKKFDIPVIYITQAIGMAVGLGDKDLGLSRHFVPVKIELTEPAGIVKPNTSMEE